MSTLLDKIMESSSVKESSAKKQEKKDKAFIKDSIKVDAELDKYSEGAFKGNLQNIILKGFQASEPLTPLMPGETQESRDRSIQAIKDKVGFNQQKIGADITMNPVKGHLRSFAAESLPYVTGGKLYQKSIEGAAKKLAPTMGDNFLQRATATAIGSSPVTAGIDIAQNRTLDEIVDNQLLDLAVSPLGGFFKIGEKASPKSKFTKEPIKQDMVFTPEELREQGLDPENYPDSGSTVAPDTKRVVLETKDGKDIFEQLKDGIAMPFNNILREELPALSEATIKMQKVDGLEVPYDVFKNGKDITILHDGQLNAEHKAEIQQAVLQHEAQHITKPGTSPEQIKAASEKYDIDQVTDYGKTFDEELEPMMKEAGNTVEDIRGAREDIINEAIYRNQEGELLARENERIETGKAPLADKTVSPYVEHLSQVMLDKKPNGEVITGKRKAPIRMEAKITPAKEMDVKTIDTVIKNNYDTAVLKTDIDNILRELGMTSKSNIIKEVEASIAHSTQGVKKLPKSKEARRAYSELMKLDKYRLGEASILPKKLADKLNKGYNLTASDKRYLKKKESHLTESERKSMETYEDIDKLLSGKTAFDDVIAIMDKYESDTPEFPAMTKEVIAEYKNNPEWFKKMRAEVVSTIRSDMKSGRIKEDAPTVSTKEITPDTAPDVKETVALETAESGALAKAKAKKRRRTKDTSSMTKEEKAMHEKGQKDYIFKDKDKETKVQKVEKEKIATEKDNTQTYIEPKKNKIDEELDKFIAEKRDNVTRRYGDDKEKMKGEVGKESTEFVPGVNNPGKVKHTESSEVFSSPETMHVEFVDGKYNTGYMAAQQAFMKTMIESSNAFNTYVHESFHKIFGDKKIEDIITSFKEDYHGKIEHYDDINMEANYNHDNPIFTYEENIVFSATDLFISKLPTEVIERLQIDLVPINKRLERLEKLTPNMQRLATELSDMADTAMKHKENYLNEFAYGKKERVFDMLDRYGEKVIESTIDSLSPLLKEIDEKAVDFSSYRKAREYADELIANVMSQANKLPAQKFIDKFTSIARATEERGKNFANITSGEVKKMFKDKKVREKITRTVMKKDMQSIKDELLSSASYDQFLATKKTNKAGIRLFLTNDVNKKIKQLIASFSDEAAMNSPHWRHNAYEILMDNPQFKKMVNKAHGSKNQKLTDEISDIVHKVDKHISMEAVSLNDFNFVKDLDKTNLAKVLEMHAQAVQESKEGMARPSSTYIKGYKPSLFRNYTEFARSPKRKNGDMWKQWKDTDLYYREAIRPDAAAGIMTQRDHVAKGALTNVKYEGSDLVKYAEEHGYGILTVDGEMKLRKVVGQDIRREILEENMDFAENMASLVENNIHDKVTGKHDVEMLEQLNEHSMITDGARKTDRHILITPKELSLFPDRIKKALINTYGRENVWIDKKYKEQLVGYSHDIGVIHHLSKSGIDITHQMLIKEAKILDTITETTQLIKQTLILKNPVVIAGNYVFQSIVAKLEGVPMKDIAKYQKEGVTEFKKYTELTERKIKLQLAGKENTAEFKSIEKKLESNIAYRLFREDKDGGGIDRNLLLKSLREKNLDRKHMEKWFTKILGGEDALGYKTASELFITPESMVGSFLIKSLNYVDYMGRSTLMRHYMKQGKSFEDAARLANSKTVSFSKQLPSSTAWIERYGFDHFLTWTLRNSVGLGVSMKEHPARWITFALMYEAITEKDERRHGASYLGALRVSSFNPGESVMSSMLDGGIYSHIGDKGALALEPEITRKIREGKNPVLTTRD